MLIPIELQILSNRAGKLTPGLVLGWRLADHISKTLAPLRDLRILFRQRDDTSMALEILARSDESPGCLEACDRGQPWDFEFFHPAGGSGLQVVIPPGVLELPEGARALESEIPERNPIVLAAMRASSERITEGILNADFGNLAHMEPFTCRPAPDEAKTCPRCGQHRQKIGLYAFNDEILCVNCTGLFPPWLRSN